MRALPVVLSLSVLLAARLPAQRLEDVATGTTVRVWRGTPTIAVIRGTLLSADTMQVVVGNARTADKPIPYQEITRFDYVASRRTKAQARGRGMLYGAGVGLGATAVMFLGTIVVGEGPNPELCRRHCWLTRRGAARTGAAVTAASTIIGAVVGGRRTERWRRVRFPRL